MMRRMGVEAQGVRYQVKILATLDDHPSGDGGLILRYQSFWSCAAQCEKSVRERQVNR